MSWRCICAIGWLLVGMVTISASGGCAAWNAERWDLDRYRDQRAVEIEGRLSEDRAIVENPF